MLLFDLTCLALSATLSATPAAAAPVVPAVQADTTQVPLTVDAINHMASFWTAFMKEAPAVRDDGRKANQETVMLGVPVNGQEMKLTGVNMAAMAKKFPSVEADLKAAQLTGQQWEDYRKALLAASVAQQVEQIAAAQAEPLHKLPVWKNVEFIKAHKKEYDALVATGMWFPKLQAGGGGGMGGGNDDLNP